MYQYKRSSTGSLWALVFIGLALLAVYIAATEYVVVKAMVDAVIAGLGG